MGALERCGISFNIPATPSLWSSVYHVRVYTLLILTVCVRHQYVSPPQTHSDMDSDSPLPTPPLVPPPGFEDLDFNSHPRASSSFRGEASSVDGISGADTSLHPPASSPPSPGAAADDEVVTKPKRLVSDLAKELAVSIVSRHDPRSSQLICVMFPVLATFGLSSPEWFLINVCVLFSRLWLFIKHRAILQDNVGQDVVDWLFSDGGPSYKLRRATFGVVVFFDMPCKTSAERCQFVAERDPIHHPALGCAMCQRVKILFGLAVRHADCSSDCFSSLFCFVMLCLVGGAYEQLKLI
jgi:hypothetical protein